MKLAYFAIRLKLHYLIVDALLLCLHLGKLSPQLLSFLHGPVLKLLVQHVLKPSVFRRNLLSYTQWLRLQSLFPIVALIIVISPPS